MAEIVTCEASFFTVKKVASLKGNKKLFIVFSTLGEREADLIHGKISLLGREAGGVIDRIILSHRRMGSGEDLAEKRARGAWDGVTVVVNNSVTVPDMGQEKGKGADMRRCLYWINTRGKAGVPPEDIIVVFLDADVHAEYFGVHFVLGLAGAVLSGSDFAKASFWRAMGRVKKYLAQPLYSVIEHPALEPLTRLSYPLSGEVAGTLDFFNGARFWQRYGVETGIIMDACAQGRRIADVNLGLYDHHHHDDEAIQRMAFGIIRTYLLQLEDYGLLELKDGARVGDIFRAAFIDETGARRDIRAELGERRYGPLADVLKD